LVAEVDVVTVDGWNRDRWADATGLPWVMPSVNLPTLDSALCYPGTCLFEGTNVSEGRGTTRPFELIGAPWVDRRWVAALAAADLPGVGFRAAAFRPTFHKYADEVVEGVQVHVTDRERFAPVATAVTMLATLRTLYPDHFRWREPDGRYFVDLLWGSDTLRCTLDSGGDPRALVAPPAHPSRWAGASGLLY